MKPSAIVVDHFKRISRIPGGKRVFSKIIGRAIPYTGSVNAVVQELEPGRAVIAMADRRGIRNHLKSVHAIALANLGEFTASLAMTTRQPPEARWIVTGINVTYVKKARGTITATADAPKIDWNTPGEHRVLATLRDPAGDVVTRVDVTLKVGPKA